MFTNITIFHNLKNYENEHDNIVYIFAFSITQTTLKVQKKI